MMFGPCGCCKRTLLSGIDTENNISLLYTSSNINYDNFEANFPTSFLFQRDINSYTTIIIDSVFFNVYSSSNSLIIKNWLNLGNKRLFIFCHSDIISGNTVDNSQSININKYLSDFGVSISYGSGSISEVPIGTCGIIQSTFLGNYFTPGSSVLYSSIQSFGISFHQSINVNNGTIIGVNSFDISESKLVVERLNSINSEIILHGGTVLSNINIGICSIICPSFFLNLASLDVP